MGRDQESRVMCVRMAFLVEPLREVFSDGLFSVEETGQRGWYPLG